MRLHFYIGDFNKNISSVTQTNLPKKNLLALYRDYVTRHTYLH